MVTAPKIMTRMTKVGISTTQAGPEQYETFYISHRGKKISRVQYDYRTQEGELFSIVARTLKECRQKRDEWLAKRNKQS
jgi:major membrane immunogen (membrane-anchored lipoprotein)